jgi:hypothetical protein
MKLHINKKPGSLLIPGFLLLAMESDYKSGCSGDGDIEVKK